MKRLIALALGGYILASLCNLPFAATPTASPTTTVTPRPATETTTITPTLTPSPVPTPTWAHFEPGIITVPIILYHHINVPVTNLRFYVTHELFDEQLELLSEQGYTTISTQTLVAAITKGADLPPRPIIITFDDGNIDTYTTAFPIMKKYGFTGVIYIVGSYVGAEQYMTADQIKEMAAAGWEVGSHSMTHSDLTLIDPEKARYEIVNSKKHLEKMLGVPVNTIAYPFGNSTASLNDYAYGAGYIAGMSLGNGSSHGAGNLFVLQRLDVKGTYNLDQFTLLLPWQVETGP
jgi:peptidoglycan/xylan/chitin deacetylase (PgdA/CDA1 family)